LVTTSQAPLSDPTAAGLTVIEVETAAEMHAAMRSAAEVADVAVMAAAVADFRPKAPEDRKVKRELGTPELVLEPTEDILADLVAHRHGGQVIVGFAAETDDVEANALRKLRSKHLDLIVANDVGAPGSGFEHDTNQVMILGADGVEEKLPMMSKADVARAVLDAAVRRLPPIRGASQ